MKFAGPTAHGVLGSASQFLCLYSLTIFDNGRHLGSPSDQSIPLGDGPERLFRSLTPQGSIFIDFSTIQSDIEKTTIFRILKNRPKWQNQSTLGRPRSVFELKTSTLGLPFGMDFSILFENGESVKQVARARMGSHTKECLVLRSDFSCARSGCLHFVFITKYFSKGLYSIQFVASNVFK